MTFVALKPKGCHFDCNTFSRGVEGCQSDYINSSPPVASFTKEVNLWLAKCPLKTNGHLANLELTSQKRKGRQDDSPDIHWRHWRQASTSPVNIKAVNLTTFSFLCSLVKEAPEDKTRNVWFPNNSIHVYVISITDEVL